MARVPDLVQFCKMRLQLPTWLGTDSSRITNHHLDSWKVLSCLRKRLDIPSVLEHRQQSGVFKKVFVLGMGVLAECLTVRLQGSCDVANNMVIKACVRT